MSTDWPPPPPAEPPPPSEPPASPVIPWEQPGVPWTTALVETVRLLLLRPREAFERVPIGGDLLKPFVFAILLGWIGTIFQTIWTVAFQGMMPSSNAYVRHPFLVPLTAVFAPVLIATGIVVWSAIFHVMLLIVGGARSGFRATLKVICYTQAVQVLQLLPGCGGLFALVGALVLAIQGLATLHRIPHGKAALAVLLPFALCCGCLIAVFVTLGAAILHHLGQNF